MTTELKAASLEDIDLLLELMAGFNQEENIDFDTEVYRELIHVAFHSPQLVKIWMIVVNSYAIGYAILTFAFSFEFGGLLATIDEIYIASEKRGKGLGTSVLELLAQEAITCGATTLNGDISDEKPWLSAFYKRAGFECYPYRPYYKQLQ
ncbi:N-acetyltransferase [Leptolyngbya sp. FACHB-261]|uniref:GNAT family N-acetyltransferase n=1 Tax=Leptolyngbya sp. FACHB-261 TaxID=2692806 RepID=UPI001685BE7A|nr:GNAT family N-acetyltransferase [Leptolyngbya sp. FACHB-261]MBD2105287.1 GNAT family N-acetyltransferase [Leptolyngbya sp. FACHB-261]